MLLDDCLEQPHARALANNPFVQLESFLLELTHDHLTVMACPLSLNQMRERLKLDRSGNHRVLVLHSLITVVNRAPASRLDPAPHIQAILAKSQILTDALLLKTGFPDGVDTTGWDFIQSRALEDAERKISPVQEQRTITSVCNPKLLGQASLLDQLSHVARCVMMIRNMAASFDNWNSVVAPLAAEPPSSTGTASGTGAERAKGEPPAAADNRIATPPDWIIKLFRSKQFVLLKALWGKTCVPESELIKTLGYSNSSNPSDTLRRRITETNNGLLEKSENIGEEWAIREMTREGITSRFLERQK